MNDASTPPDLWHVGELPGDRGRTIRDQNGLKVAEAGSRAAARRTVRRNNHEELGRIRGEARDA